MKKNTGIIRQIRQGLHDMLLVWAEEMKLTVKDEGVLIFFILVPLLYPLLYSWIYTNEVVREVPVAVIDMSHSGTSREFTRMFDASPDVSVAYRCGGMDEAKDLIARQEVFGILYFPADFQTRLNRMEQSHLNIYCDMSFMLYYKAVYQTASAVAGQLNAKFQTVRAGNWTEHENEISVKPLDFDEVQMFNTTGGYGNFIIPGVLMLIIQQTLLLGAGLAAGTTRERNRMELLVPVSRHYNGIFRIVLGKSLCYFMIYAIIAAYITLVVPHLFNFVSMVHATDMLLFMLPYLLSCIFFALTVSSLVRYRENIMLLVVFTSVPLLFLSGVSWPQSGIPEFWQRVSTVFPSTFGIRGFVRMNTMGARLGDVLSEYHVLWLQTLAYFILTCLIYRWQIIRTRKRLIDLHKKEKTQ